VLYDNIELTDESDLELKIQINTFKNKHRNKNKLNNRNAKTEKKNWVISPIF
jgi:hypothetical protein